MNHEASTFIILQTNAMYFMPTSSYHQSAVIHSYVQFDNLGRWVKITDNESSTPVIVLPNGIYFMPT